MTRIGISGGQLRHLNVEQILQKADEFGAEAVELHWGMNLCSLQEAEGLKGLFAASDKVVDVLNTNLFWSADELEDLSGLQSTFDECIRAAELLGARFVLVHCACPPREELDAPEARVEIERYLEALRPGAAACVERGLTLVVENYFDTLVRSPEGTLRLLQEAEGLGLRLAFDPSNFYNSAAEPYPLAYHLLKDYISVLHAKDSARYQSALYAPEVKVSQRVLKVVFLPMGTGAVNWEGLSDELLRGGFDGPITIEPNTALEHLDSTFAANIRYLWAKGFGRKL